MGQAVTDVSVRKDGTVPTVRLRLRHVRISPAEMEARARTPPKVTSANVLLDSAARTANTRLTNVPHRLARTMPAVSTISMDLNASVLLDLLAHIARPT